MFRFSKLIFASVLAGQLLSGCSTHPLPEDMIDLPIHEIVHQIQCEAARTVRAVYHEQGFSALHDDYLRITKYVDGANQKLKALEDLLEANNDLGTTESELKNAKSSIKLQLLQVSEAAELVVTSPASDELKHAKLDRLEAEKDHLKVQWGMVNVALRTLPKIANLKKNIQRANSDLGKGKSKDGALAQYLQYVLNGALLEFEFEVTEDNNATAGGTITWPITLGTIKLVYDAGEEKQRKNKRNVKVTSTFAEFVDEKKLNCWDVDVADAERFPSRYPITGSIGLDEVISDYLVVAHSKSGRFGGKDGESYSNTITFTTTLHGGLNPSIALSKRMGQLIDADVDLSVSRKDIHKVIIYLNPYKGETRPAASPEIIIRQMPAVRTRTRVIRQEPLG